MQKSKLMIAELLKENLCTHFILPLLRVNKFSFNSSNFVNCYLAAGDKITVKIIEKAFVHGRCFTHVNFRGILTDSLDYSYYVYQLPGIWADDLCKFKEGKYSEMSKLAKDTIKVQSGLAVNKIMLSGKPETDIRILALDKHRVVKRMWEEEINPWEEISGELLSIPDEKSYIDLSTLTPDVGVIA